MSASTTAARSHRLFILGGYSVLVAGFVLMGVVPFMRQRSTIGAGIATCQEDINKRLDGKKQLEAIEGHIQLIKLQTNNYGRLVPTNQDLSDFLEKLSGELDHAHMKDVTVRALPANILGKTQKTPIEVHCSGTFAQFRQFLENLEGLQRMSTVGRLSIDADTDMTGGVDVQLTLFIYNTKPASP